MTHRHSQQQEDGQNFHLKAAHLDAELREWVP